MIVMQRYDFKTKQYGPPEPVPEGASLYETDMEKIVACADCQGKLEYGYTFTSRRLHNPLGLGFGVCGACYHLEFMDSKLASIQHNKAHKHRNQPDIGLKG